MYKVPDVNVEYVSYDVYDVCVEHVYAICRTYRTKTNMAHVMYMMYTKCLVYIAVMQYSFEYALDL